MERKYISTRTRHFNPRSLVGNDGASIEYKSDDNPFQSTFPRGERLHPMPEYRIKRISIHVPSWGTTARSFLPVCSLGFQSTFPRGERRVNTRCGIPRSVYFNPRSLVGNDATSLIDTNIAIISIHVPSWGTTANFHKYSLFFYAINIIFLLFIIPSLFSLVLFMLLF